MVLLALSLPASAVTAPKDSAQNRLDVYAGEVTPEQLDDVVGLGVDRREMQIEVVPGSARGAKRRLRIETVLSGRQAGSLRAQGIDLQAKTVGGATTAQRSTALAAEGFEVFKKYGGPGGIKEEFEQVAAANPEITKLVVLGKTHQGQDIVAMKVTRGARNVRDGARPSVLYIGAQHAREWITPEMIRRLMHHLVDNYDNDPEIRRLVNQNELWLVPVSNPDGYDWSFEPGQRLWRKNLRDNNRDGQITPGDGVDLNRNYPTKWGYDNEGSSPDPESETYRGPRPASEPETQALIALGARVRFDFLVNYHSAAELLLYGTGWQVATPGPDDVLYEAMAGDDANPAIAGYDPDISAELYTTNGDTDTHFTEAFDTLGFTPEMATCEEAANSVPDDEWVAAEDCVALGFDFPDDEALIQAEFEKNLPFALSVARSADEPDDPDSVVGRTAEEFRLDPFTVSHGDPQTVAVVAKRELRRLRLNFRINGGPARSAPTDEWQGGERYGDENEVYYAEYRGVVTGAAPGDQVEVWFTAERPNGRNARSASFTYTVAADTTARVLVVANEDYEGVNPTYDPPITAPKYAALHEAAVEASGYSADVWDVSAQGVPHDLGVLSHYDAIVWYLGDNRFTQDPEDELVETFAGDLPEMAVAERQQYLTMAVRDFLNEGGKLIHAGETAQHQGLPGFAEFIGGVYYGLNGDPTAECEITANFGGDCLILADDFRQYYLGAFNRVSFSAPDGVLGIARPINGVDVDLGGPVVEGDNPLDEAGLFLPTSDVLPRRQFPQFDSRGAAVYVSGSVGPFDPFEGTRYAGMLHSDFAYSRLTRTIDLAGATTAQLQFQLSLNIESDFDNLIVEAHTVGQDNWTTLAETGGATSTNPPADCEFAITDHPFLTHYLDETTCTSPGSTGTWNAVTGATNGWEQVNYDLTAFAGQQVEVSISYVSDIFVGVIGAFVDDTRVIIDGVSTNEDGFEGATSAWSVTGPPEGSPGNDTEWQITEKLLDLYAATSTEDTLLLGFGLEQLATDADRVELLRKALNGLLG